VERNLAVAPPHGVVIAPGLGRLNAVTETRRITFEGSGPFVRMLVQALEDEGVTVAVRRERPDVDQRPIPCGMVDAVKATQVRPVPARRSRPASQRSGSGSRIALW
jgi:hypothetical protein